MTHGHTRIPTRGFCVYCGASDVRLTDEHVVPLSLGGKHILEKASCDRCANITKKFEQDVARELWGDARKSYDAPSRRKKQRKSHVVLRDPNNPSRTAKIPYSEYPAAMVFYTMDKAGMLRGLPEFADVSNDWKLVAIHTDAKAKDFEKKWGVPLVSKFRHVPESFARTIAKIAYCNTLCAIDPREFDPICLPYILGTKQNLSYIVGAATQNEPRNDGMGYVLSTDGLISADGMLIVGKVRLIANNDTPTYHVVVGRVAGRQRSENLLLKMTNGNLALPKGVL